MKIHKTQNTKQSRVASRGSCGSWVVVFCVLLEMLIKLLSIYGNKPTTNKGKMLLYSILFEYDDLYFRISQAQRKLLEDCERPIDC